MNKSKSSGMWGAIIWLGYVAYMWMRKGGIKHSVSALFGYISGSYLRRRVIIAVIYTVAAFFLARAIYLMSISTLSTVIGIIGAVGLAGAGLIPDSRDSKGNFSKLKDRTHVVSTLIAIVCSVVYTTLGSILTKEYLMLAIPVVTIGATVYMLRKKIKNYTTWIELVVFFAVMLFVFLN